jgi:hypothetical protein
MELINFRFSQPFPFGFGPPHLQLAAGAGHYPETGLSYDADENAKVNGYLC